MSKEMSIQLAGFSPIEIPKSTRVIIVEGFEKTGKSTYLRGLHKNYGMRVIDPDYHNKLGAFYQMDYSDRYIINLSLIDCISNGIIEVSPDSILAINRGVVSGAAYAEIYNQRLNCDIDKVLTRMAHLYRKLGVHHIYVEHQNSYAAKDIYYKADATESYDEFGGFEDYWNNYQKFDNYFAYLFDKYGVDFSTTHVVDD